MGRGRGIWRVYRVSAYLHNQYKLLRLIVLCNVHTQLILDKMQVIVVEVDVSCPLDGMHYVDDDMRTLTSNHYQVDIEYQYMRSGQ
jgi:hypothetical protein